MLAVTANAYTIVMRGGRRIEIPAQFVVTPSTLTYEAATGFQITLQMAAIDIPATEIANNEEPGSLLRRIQLTTASSSPTATSEEDEQSAQPTQARRTITNRDLESSMRRRRASEVAYESRRKQLGLPSTADSRKQAAVESDSFGMELEQRRIAEKESEDYWRGRAEALRTEIAAVDAQIAWTRARLDETPFSSNGWGNGSAPTITSVIPYFGDFGRRSYGDYGGDYGGWGYPRGGWHQRDVYVAPGDSPRTVGRGGYGRGRRGGGFFDPWIFPQGRPIGGGVIYPGVDVFGSSTPDYSYERADLITRFNELASTRAGLSARWRALEEEARRAGAPPGWLRP